MLGDIMTVCCKLKTNSEFLSYMFQSEICVRIQLKQNLRANWEGICVLSSMRFSLEEYRKELTSEVC